MKKITSVMLILALCLGICMSFAGCGEKAMKNLEAAAGEGDDFSVGVCQLMKHDALDQATQGFVDGLTEEVEKAGKTVNINVQVAGDTSLCATVINTFVSLNVDLIMGNATPAMLAAANGAPNIPVLGTSVTDYADTFSNNIPANVCGTSDAVPFDEQAQMMIDSLNLVEGDLVGVLYCANESNSKLQYEAVKALFEQKGIKVKAYTFTETTEMNSVVNAMVSEVKAVYVPSDNTVSANESVVATICSEKKIPVYTSYGGSMCYASLAIDYYQLGYKTGVMAAQILLEGKTPAEVGIETLEPSVVYNKEVCENLGIAVPEN